MRRTHHPHGLQLASGTVFWINDGKSDEQGDYFACVSAEGRRFERYQDANQDVMTYAQQVLWTRELASVGISPTREQEIHRHCVLRPVIRRWLEANVGTCGPDWYVRAEPFDLMFQSVLFRRRRDALALIRHVCASLKPHADEGRVRH